MYVMQLNCLEKVSYDKQCLLVRNSGVLESVIHRILYTQTRLSLCDRVAQNSEAHMMIYKFIRKGLCTKT